MSRAKDNNGKDINSLITELAVMGNQLDTIESNVNDIKKKLESEYVTRDQFEPVRNIVYGMVSVILLAVVGALVALVVAK